MRLRRVLSKDIIKTVEDIEDFTAVALDKHTLYITFTAVTAQREQISIEDEVNI